MRQKAIPALLVILITATWAYCFEAAGKWAGMLPNNQAITFEFKVSGVALSGTMKQGQSPSLEISEGKVVDASNITFNVVGPQTVFPGASQGAFAFRFEGKFLDATTIHITRTTPTGAKVEFDIKKS